jgi:hypothetical protein
MEILPSITISKIKKKYLRSSKGRKKIKENYWKLKKKFYICFIFIMIFVIIVIIIFTILLNYCGKV